MISSSPFYLSKYLFTVLATLCAVSLGQSTAFSAELERGSPSLEIMSDREWGQIDDSVERALSWLAANQQRDGSFPTIPQGQPAVTGLCTMAFMAHGHLPGEGEYGEQLENALNYIASCQKRSGIIALVAPNSPTIQRNVPHEVGWKSSYNHAISSLALSEGFTTGRGLDVKHIEKVVTKALAATQEMQNWRKTRREDIGGWRYVNRYRDGLDSDLSVTGWYLMSLRSAKNAGFDVPKESIDSAVEYIGRCFHRQYGTYQLMANNDMRLSRGMAGAGILAMAHAGRHDSPEVLKSGEWILNYGFDNYNVQQRGWSDDRYHYGVFHCSQAMYQLGGQYWEQFFPPVAKTLVANQQRNGSWQRESRGNDRPFGETYTTSLMVLTLGAPNQLLPIFQR